VPTLEPDHLLELSMPLRYVVSVGCTVAITLILGACAHAPAVSPAESLAVAPTCKALVPEFHTGTEARHERFNAISKEGKARVVFLGDSITQGWEGPGRAVWTEKFEPLGAANFGISGDRTEHVLWRLEHGNFDGLKPELIVVMIGTNNTGHRKDPSAETAAGVLTIVEKLQAKCPDARILLLAIFPRGETKSDPLRVLNDGANALVRERVDGKRVVWLDVGDKYLNADGTMKKDLMPDLLHPNEKGYVVWGEAIEGKVRTMLGDAR
jgi:N-acetylglucosamine-6-sulfatase